ncbi:MAG: hypothetical protein ACREYC_28465 [Gammaproteobacteria bacterium]
MARADFLAVTVFRLKLRVGAVPEKNYEQHAVIVGWPAEKHTRKMLAVELSQAATLQLPKPSLISSALLRPRWRSI